ncbi:transposable element Tcb1 transposase [Trichonephila clavipes]|nr:transposable element Tcb1 transposase [Trichonephila clavipes]
MQYQCILDIDFMKESKLTLDFDQKSLVIPDDQIKQLPKVEKPVEIDLSDTKLGEGQKQKLKDLFNGFKGQFSDQAGLTQVLYHEIDTGDKGPVVSRPYRYDKDVFNKVKRALTEAPVLQLPNFQEQFNLFTDASGVGTGAVLNQNHRPIAFALRTLNKAEVNYTVTERERVAVIWTFNKFKTYFGSLPVKVITDHAALTKLTNGKNLSSRMIRWALKLSEFKIEWEHQSGVQNIVADILSRNPVGNMDGSQISCAALRALALNSREQLVREQREDPELGHIYRYLENLDDGSVNATVSENWSQDFKLIDGLLFYANYCTTLGELRVYIPRSLRQTIMQEFHDLPLAGHLGKRKTCLKLRDTCYFPYMRKYTLCRKKIYAPRRNQATITKLGKNVVWGRIIDLREAGWSNRRIGRHLGRSDMVVARCWQQWITEGKVYRRGGSGRPRNTNDREDRAIRRVATSAPTTSLASIQRHLPPSRHPVPSRETIRRRLTEVGLRSRRPLRRLPLTPHHRQCRQDFCRPRATWSVTDWRRVIFSDESRFSLSADDHRTRVWRRTGQRSEPAFIVERHTAISQGVTVWGAISWDTRSSLVVLQGTLTARRYVDDILTPIVLPMLSSRPGAIYQQDNARPHTARLSQQCLQGYDVLPWPARSPDLSPIEHVCDALGRQLQPSRDTGELTAQMQRLWQDLPQGVISDLIESMPRRISACIAARGGFTTY